MISLIFCVIAFFCGYYISRRRVHRKIAISKLLGIKGYISQKCREINARCSSVLEEIRKDPESEDNKNRVTFLSVFSNVHDELVEDHEKFKALMVVLDIEDDIEKINRKIEDELSAFSK